MKVRRALEIANARHKEGTGTQIDVLNAQTALTDARASNVNALRNYSVARASLIRATGADILPETKPGVPQSEHRQSRRLHTGKTK